MACCKTLHRIDVATGAACRTCACPLPDAERGQSTVEAAVVLPVLMLLFALLMQPVCVLYTRMLMRHVAFQTARVLATSADVETSRSFALRRLRAVPEASLFHVGGSSDWQVRLNRSPDARFCDVTIAGHVRPLPLFGVVAGALGRRDATGLLIEVDVHERVRPDWLGGEYETWMEAW